LVSEVGSQAGNVVCFVRVYKVVQRLVFELFLLVARHGIAAEDFKHLFKLFDAEHPPVVC